MTTHWRPETIAVHGAADHDAHDSGSPVDAVVPVAPAIHQTASFLLPTLDHAASAYGRDGTGEAFTYSRYGNPTCAALERQVAELEHGAAAVTTGSGMAAIALTVLTLAEAGDNIVSSSDLYGGTRALFAHTLRRMGIQVRFVDPDDPDAFLAASDAHTRLWFGETLPNPSLRALPVRELAERGRPVGIPLVVDNTAAPLLARPLDHGAAVVVHSATKWLGGHGTALGGVVVDGGFPWARHPERHPSLCAPDPSYHDVVWTDLAAAQHGPLATAAFAVRLRRTVLRDLGPALAPAAAALLLQGLQTLPVRLKRQCESTVTLVAWLGTRPEIERVNHPSLHTGGLARRRDAVLSGGHGSLIGIDLRGGLAAARRFVGALRLVRHVVNIGDVRTLATHPASTTHAQLDAEAQRAAGVGPGYVRLSVGLEHPDDLIDDLSQALLARGGDVPPTDPPPTDPPSTDPQQRPTA